MGICNDEAAQRMKNEIEHAMVFGFMPELEAGPKDNYAELLDIAANHDYQKYEVRVLKALIKDSTFPLDREHPLMTKAGFKYYDCYGRVEWSKLDDLSKTELVALYLLS